jgi:hypothetical protein
MTDAVQKTKTITLATGVVAVETTLGKFAVRWTDGSIDLYRQDGAWIGWCNPDGTVNEANDSGLGPDLVSAWKNLTTQKETP